MKTNYHGALLQVAAYKLTSDTINVYVIIESANFAAM